MEYLTISQVAEKWNISDRRIQVLCSQQRIPGAYQLGRIWAIPADAEKPADARIRSGKYRKLKKEKDKCDRERNQRSFGSNCSRG